MNTIKLFKEILSCQDCLFSWEGYTHGFARGHGVFEKDGKIVFASDDLIYAVPSGEAIEIEQQLKLLGWHLVESCPKCSSLRLFPHQYPEQNKSEIECITINRDDLEKRGKLWQLSASAITKLS